MKRWTFERIVLGIFALGLWVLALAALVVGSYLLLGIHFVQGGSEWDGFVVKARLLGAGILLVGVLLSWGAYVMSRDALDS